jgi:hypothetical protein
MIPHHAIACNQDPLRRLLKYYGWPSVLMALAYIASEQKHGMLALLLENMANWLEAPWEDLT